MVLSLRAALIEECASHILVAGFLGKWTVPGVVIMEILLFTTPRVLSQSLQHACSHRQNSSGR